MSAPLITDSRRRRTRLRVLSAALVGLLALLSAPATATASGPADEADRPPVRNGYDYLISVVQQDLGLSKDQVVSRLASQRLSEQRGDALRKQLGADFGGLWIDEGTGTLVVGVTRGDRAAQVRSAGATPKVVRHSLDTLNAIKGELDRLASDDENAVAGLASWHVDQPSNSVVVSVVSGHSKAAVPRSVARHGEAVRVELGATAPRLTAGFLDAGDLIRIGHTPCSSGFNLRSGNRGYLLTAGHCAVFGNSSQVVGSDGTFIGPVVGRNFPNRDHAIIANDNPGYWVQGPWVEAYEADPNQIFPVTGSRASAPGGLICKSGIGSGVTCGLVGATNETVNFEGNVVGGLTRTSSCAQPGDSGSPAFSPDALQPGIGAEGVTIGSELFLDVNGNLRCGEVFGIPNRSWFTPISEPLTAYGLIFGVSLWTV
ncbi:S1 family peptidase [Actinophytocola xanthii]|uniref:Peptidase S1A alpha-lytic prodomain domain-containing protein n=1 Tax=Actinophytocola xanthii TaxID=1912961 RepID=A0A1Q8CGY6_9PSEU|nr:S1 family peptidase [Actinophytocola xanthii]OLF13604.1 hypothetical protein BU204_26545 [Actinophytocola xanthii]